MRVKILKNGEVFTFSLPQHILYLRRLGVAVNLRNGERAMTENPYEFRDGACFFRAGGLKAGTLVDGKWIVSDGRECVNPFAIARMNEAAGLPVGEELLEEMDALIAEICG